MGVHVVVWCQRCSKQKWRCIFPFLASLHVFIVFFCYIHIIEMIYLHHQIVKTSFPAWHIELFPPLPLWQHFLLCQQTKFQVIPYCVWGSAHCNRIHPPTHTQTQTHTDTGCLTGRQRPEVNGTKMCCCERDDWLPLPDHLQRAGLSRRTGKWGQLSFWSRQAAGRRGTMPGLETHMKGNQPK